MRLVLSLLLAVWLATPAAAVNFESSQLVIQRQAGGPPAAFTVELAVTSEQRSQGLMFRERLAEDAGMLFIFPQLQPVQMWMKNTLIPLDMLFLGADGGIVAMAVNTVPQSEAIIAPGLPVKAVLELSGGTAQRLGIAPGDRVLHPLLQN